MFNSLLIFSFSFFEVLSCKVRLFKSVRIFFSLRWKLSVNSSLILSFSFTLRFNLSESLLISSSCSAIVFCWVWLSNLRLSFSRKYWPISLWDFWTSFLSLTISSLSFVCVISAPAISWSAFRFAFLRRSCWSKPSISKSLSDSWFLNWWIFSFRPSFTFSAHSPKSFPQVWALCLVSSLLSCSFSPKLSFSSEFFFFNSLFSLVKLLFLSSFRIIKSLLSWIIFSSSSFFIFKLFSGVSSSSSLHRFSSFKVLLLSWLGGFSIKVSMSRKFIFGCELSFKDSYVFFMFSNSLTFPLSSSRLAWVLL